MGFAQTFSKYILWVFNIIFFLASVVLVGLGIWLKVDKSNIHRVLVMVKFDGGVHASSSHTASLIDIIAILMIVIGVIIMIASFCGCCGAMKENKILLYSYLFILCVIVIIEVAVVILVAVKRTHIHNALDHEFKRVLVNNYNGIASDNSTLFTKVFGAMMIKLKCCGVTGREDFDLFNTWKTVVRNKSLENPIPCCKFKPDFRFSVTAPVKQAEVLDAVENKACMTEANSDSINKVGCSNVLWDIIVNKMKIIIGIMVAVAVFEIACIIFACCIINKSYEKVK